MSDGNQTISITGDTRTGGVPQDKVNLVNAVWEIVIKSVFDTDDTSLIVQSVSLNGILRHVTVTIPDTNTDNTTSQILITNNNGDTIFDTGELDEGETHTFSVDIPLSGATGVSVEPSAGAGTGGNITIITLQGI